MNRASRVVAARRLDADYRCTEVGEHHARQTRNGSETEFDDGEAFECAHG
jgi:hypothetical protein